jgi:BASS family bile acid:Na+ symporter
VAVATGLLVLLLVITIGYMPLVVPLIAPDADVSAGSIAQPLVLTMLLPLITGLVADFLSGGWTKRLLPILGPVSSGALIVLIISTVIANFDQIGDVFGTGAILAALLFVAGAFSIGYLLGMIGTGTRDELGLATGQRNIAAATVVATQSIGEPDTTVMVIVTSMAAMAILFPTAALLRRNVEQRNGKAPARGQTAG